MKYGVVGTSWITDAFIKSCEPLDSLALTSVYSRTYQRATDFAKKYGIPFIYTDIFQMAADNNIDAVYIASPNSLHFEQSKIFLENGKHVLCEKPAALSYNQLKQLIELAKSKGLIYMEAMMNRHVSVRNTLKSELLTLGKISNVRLDFTQYSKRLKLLKSGEIPNVFNPAMGGGALNDLGVYCVYLAVDLFGYPLNTYAKANFLSSGADAGATVILSYDGFDAVLTFSKTAQGNIGSEINGENGTITIGSVSQLMNINVIDAQGTVKRICGSREHFESMSAEAICFYNFVNHLPKFRTSYDDVTELAVKVCRVMDEIRNQF